MPGPDERAWRARLAELGGTGSAEGGAALVVSTPAPALAARLGATEYDATDPGLPVLLAAAGPFGLIVDDAEEAGFLARVRTLGYHLRAGGRLVARVPSRPGPRRRFLAYVDRLDEARAAGLAAPERYGDFRPASERDLAADAVSLRITVDGDFAEVTSGVSTLPKLREEEVDRLLELRPGLGRVLHRLPAERFESRCELRTGPTDVPLDLPASYDVPALCVREYDEAEFWTRQAVTAGGVVLPASFRHHTRGRLLNKELRDWAPRFVLAQPAPSRRLEGSWFLLDSFARGHFGHALTDQVALLWGWRWAKQRDPGLRALVSRVEGRELAEWERQLFEAGGVPADDLVLVDEPVRVEHLVTATSMYVMPDYVHPDLLATYDEIGTALGGLAPAGERPLRVFLTREGRRACHNAREVEALFEAAGFEVLRPELLPLPEQVALMRAAEVVAGFSGSALFQVAFAGGPKHVITIGPESYAAPNEYLIASVLGHRLDRVFCRPDVPRGDRFSEASYHSDYTFDPDREGVFLREVLDSL